MSLNLRENIHYMPPVYSDDLIADVAAPSAVADGFEVKKPGMAGPRYYSLKGRISGGSAAAMKACVWYWDQATEKWYPSQNIKFYTDAEIAAAAPADNVGNVYRLEADEGTTRIHVSVPSGPAEANVLSLVVRKGT